MMTLARGLLLIGVIAFVLTGLGYLLVPGTMLGVVGVESTPTTDFLIRTEGVALLAGAGLLWAARQGTSRVIRVALFSLAGYLVVGSVVDLVAFANGIVGPASVPSAALRIVLAALCVTAVATMGGRPE